MEADELIASFVAERVSAKDLVKHDTLTKGEWVPIADVFLKILPIKESGASHAEKDTFRCKIDQVVYGPLDLGTVRKLGQLGYLEQHHLVYASNVGRWQHAKEIDSIWHSEEEIAELRLQKRRDRRRRFQNKAAKIFDSANDPDNHFANAVTETLRGALLGALIGLGIGIAILIFGDNANRGKYVRTDFEGLKKTHVYRQATPAKTQRNQVAICAVWAVLGGLSGGGYALVILFGAGQSDES